MTLFFGFCFFLYFLKLSAGRDFRRPYCLIGFYVPRQNYHLYFMIVMYLSVMH